ACSARSPKDLNVRGLACEILRGPNSALFLRRHRMRILKALLLSLPLSLLAVTHAPDAAACGGCFGPPTEITQVTGHKMILSVSKTQTTLWDQITYSGNPSSFGWILPIKGTVDVALSSDALFQALEQNTQVSVTAPIISCPPPPPGCILVQPLP